MIRKGVILVFVGILVLLLAAMLDYVAYGSLIRAAEDPWGSSSSIAQGYEEARMASIASVLGTIIAFAGIAIALYGVSAEPIPAMPMQQPPQQWQQEPPQQYPPQP
jgi:uncharacterized membrane protein